MNATPSRSFHSLHSLPQPKDGTGGVTKSHPKVLKQSSVTASGLAAGNTHARALDFARRRALSVPDAEGVLPLVADGFGNWFLPALSRWLQANFANIEHVSRAFGVRHSTARNWWNGQNCASGEAVGVVFLTFPAAIAWFMAEWEGR